MTVAILTVLSRINPFSTTDEPTGPTGADAIRTAVQEFQDLVEREFTATLGEPDIIEQESQFFNDPKVVVPVYDGPFEEEQRLVFDLPRGEDIDIDQFNQLLDLFGLDFESMEELDGEQAPVKFVGGNLVVDWNSMNRPDSLDKGGEEDPHTEEDVQEVLDNDSENGVNVEETTISADDADDEGDDA